MRQSKISRQIVTFMLLLFQLLLFMPSGYAEGKTLTKETKLHPQGWTVGDQLKFKKDSVVMTNELGEVISGTLADDTFLRPLGWQLVLNVYYYVSTYAGVDPFSHHHQHFVVGKEYNTAVPSHGHLQYKGGTQVTFNEYGEVISGTIGEDATVQLVKDKYGFLNFKEDNILVFYDSGVVRSGVLEEDTNLRPVGWRKNYVGEDSAGFVKFSAKKKIEFNEYGEVMSGTLKEPLKWKSPDGVSVEFSANTIIHFDEQGAVAEKSVA